MISVYYTTRGDVYYTCTTCETRKFVPMELKESPFWDIYNGITILQMLGHFENKHTIPRLPPKTQANPEYGVTTQWPVAN